jgi:hypothetical protein
MEKTNKTKSKRKYTRRQPQTKSQLANIKQHSRIQTAVEAQSRMDKYFKDCEKKKRPLTIAGLVNALGLISRQSLLNYENEEKHTDISKEEKLLIVDTIKRARMKVEQYLEENLINGKQVAGTIFNMKNNFGYIDRTDLQHGGNIIFEIEGLEKF